MHVNRTHILVEGLKKLKDAALFYIIASILAGIAITTRLAVRGALGLTTLAVAGVAGGILALIALFVYLIPGFNRLSMYDPSLFRTPRILVLIGLAIGYIMLIITQALAISGLIAVASVLALVTIVLLLVGYVGFLIGLFRLKNVTGESLFMVAGILFIIGVFVRIVIFIGWIILYIGARRALKKYETPRRPPPAAATPTVVVPR